MATPITERLDGGVVTARDATQLAAGQLQQAIGAWYKPSDNRLWKQRGRSAFADTGSAAVVKGVKVIQFDDDTAKVVALSGTVLYSATAGDTGTFASIKTGLASAATHLSLAHNNNRWYGCTDADADRPFVIEASGTVYDMGMQPQVIAPTTAAGTGTGSIIRPAAPTGDMVSGALSMDTNLNTFGTLSAGAAATKTATWTTGAWTGAAATRQLVVKWAVQALPIFDSDVPPSGRPGDAGGSLDMGANVTVKFEMDSTPGAYATILNQTLASFVSPQTFVKDLGSIDPDNCSFRATLTYNSGQTTVALRIYDVRLQQGSATATFSTTTGFYYAIREIDQTRPGRGSPIKAASILTTLTTQNQVTITRPAIVNSTTTHWEVYRTSDGGVAPIDLGLIATVPIADSTFIDDFSAFPASTSPPYKYPMMRITVDEGVLFVDRDQPPPQLDRIFGFKHSLVGVRGRSLYYAISGLPESWPEVYQIGHFDYEENETLLTGADLGEMAIIGSDAGLLRLQELPRVAIGNFAYSKPEPIAGAPGVVGPYAMTKFSIGGEPRVAWISQDGICVSNGFSWQRISDTWDWSGFEGLNKSGWVLHYDSQRFVLVVAYATTGTTNNRHALAHVHPSLAREGQPIWTLAHYSGIYDLASSNVAGTRRLYSAHASNGIVYLEDNGTTDASQSYSSTTLPLIVQTRRLHGESREWAALKAWLRHSDFGASQSLTVAWTTSRDEGSSQTRTQTVSLVGAERTLFDVARSGEWHEITLTHTGAATGALVALDIEPRSGSGTGLVAAT
jgi:hypothetical protein